MLPKRLDRTKIYESDWINLYADKVLMPAGKVCERYHFIDIPKKSVVVLLINNNDEILLIKSLRYITQRESWELPSGFAENSETILETAKREALEETGYNPEKLEHIVNYFPSEGITNQQVDVFVGYVADGKQQQFDRNEVKETRWISVEEIRRMIKKKEIINGISLIGIFYYISGLAKEMG